VNHLKGYATPELAARSKAAGLLGAYLDENCPCGKVHVKQAKTPKAEAPARLRAKPGSMTAAVALVLAGEVTVAGAARRCEVDPAKLDARAWAVVKADVLEFFSWTCLACGEMACDVHHRVRRGTGGTADPVIAFGRVNLAPLCRHDHDRCHAGNPEMLDRGFQLRTVQDPARVPVGIATEYGQQRTWLLASGGISLADPYADVAA
jgi:hypothetical protein